MAFCILVEFNAKNVDWKRISDNMSFLRKEIDIFPIPKNKIFKKNYLGISIGGVIDDNKKKDVISLIEYFLSLDCKIRELYSHREFTAEGYIQLIQNYLN